MDGETDGRHLGDASRGDGRDHGLEAIARGLEEVVEEPYLKYRVRSTAYLAEKVAANIEQFIKPQ